VVVRNVPGLTMALSDAAIDVMLRKNPAKLLILDG
jgi:hypothetical protein